MVLLSKFLLNGNANDAVGSNNWTPTSVTWKAWKANQWASVTTTWYINCWNVLNQERNVPSTHCFLINTTDNSVDKQIISKQKQAASNQWKWIQMKTGKIWFFLYTWGSNSISKQTTTTINNWKWNHISVARDGSWTWSNTKIYYNWVSQPLENWNARTQTISSWTVLTTDTFQINWRRNTADSTMTMEIDETSIYSHQLTDWQIKTQSLYYAWYMFW